MNLAEQLIRDEGNRSKPYLDCCGKPWRLCKCDPKGHLTIGAGINLDAGISASEGWLLLRNRMAAAKEDLLRVFPWVGEMDNVRQAAFINLTYNMGIGRLCGFRRMMAAARDGQWGEAAQELLDSRYATQVGDRAKRLAKQLATGEWQ